MQQLVRKSVLWQLALAICLLTTTIGCKDDNINPYDNFDAVAQAEKEDKLIKAYLEEFLELTPADYTRTPSGLYYVVKKAGNGVKPVKGQQVEMHYVGKFVENSQIFDSSYKRAEIFKFVLGQNRVIKGWEEGVPMMSKGESGLLILPSHLAYGRFGNPMSGMPGNATLMFELDLIDF